MEANLNFTQPDGSTKRQHLQAVAKQTGRIPEELNVPEVPAPVMFIKYCFDSMSTYRQWENGFPMMLSPMDIYYWCKLEGEKLSARQLKAIKKLDITQVNSIVKLIQERRS